MKNSFCDICGMTIKSQVIMDEETAQPRGVNFMVWDAERARVEQDPNIAKIKEIYPILKYFKPHKEVDLCQECLRQASVGFINWANSRMADTVDLNIKTYEGVENVRGK